MATTKTRTDRFDQKWEAARMAGEILPGWEKWGAYLAIKDFTLRVQPGDTCDEVRALMGRPLSEKATRHYRVWLFNDSGYPVMLIFRRGIVWRIYRRMWR